METRSIAFSLIALFLCLSIGNVLRSQSADEIEAYQPVSELDELPTFPGGLEEMSNYLIENLNYPVAARENAIEGEVRVEFVVGPQGDIVEPIILEGLGYGCDEEVLRIINDMPRWTAGAKDYRKVATKMVVSISFQLTI
ncbi:MAG: energy transducer TonB [Saprospiraceae bacterium]|nr:energy transducer TonB [Saprospiraceae bacterium]